MKRFFYSLFKISLIIIVLIAFVAGGIMVTVRNEFQEKVYPSVNNLPEDSTMVVLGASVYRDRTPSDALEDRLDMAVRAYRANKVKRIILSGDDGRWAQEEVQTMLNYMYNRDVPDSIIIVDGNNARTFDSCYRLKNELRQNDVVLVTQSFHMPRALYLCNKMGLDAWGLESDLRMYKDIVWFTVRDWMASLLAWWDIYNQRLPSYLQAEVINY